MATASRNPAPMPGPEVPLLLPNGLINPDWYAWLKQFYDAYKVVRSEIP